MTASLKLLRQIVGETHSLERERLKHSLIDDGLPKGAITELYGSGKTEFTVQFLAEHPGLQVAWVEDELSIYPCGFLQRQVNLNRVLFTEAGAHSVWATLQSLRSGLFQVVVLTQKKSLDEKVLRRLQLATEKAQAVLLLLSQKAHRAWPIRRQLQVYKTPQGLCTREFKKP